MYTSNLGNVTKDALDILIVKNGATSLERLFQWLFEDLQLKDTEDYN